MNREGSMGSGLRRLGVLGLTVLLGCDAAEGDGDAAAAGRASGSWSVELRLEQPPQLGRDAQRIPPVRGDLVLLARRSGRGATHHGSHTVPAHAFGMSLREGRVPGALAWARGDSLTVVL